MRNNENQLVDLLTKMYLQKAQMQDGKGGCCGGRVKPKSQARQQAGAQSEYARFVKEFSSQHKGEYANGQELMKMAAAQWRSMKQHGGLTIGGQRKRASKRPSKKVAPRKAKGGKLVTTAQLKKWLADA
jgi:hypothetical protein